MHIVVPDAHEALAGLADGATLAVGGFGLCGVPRVLVQAVLGATWPAWPDCARAGPKTALAALLPSCDQT